MVALGLEEREKQQFGPGIGHALENRPHVGVAFVHGGEKRRSAALPLEFLPEALGQAQGVEVAVVDDGRAADAEAFVGVAGGGRAGVFLVRGGAEIAGLPFRSAAAAHGGEIGGAVVAGYHGEARLGHDLGGRRGVPGAGRAEDGHHGRIGHDAQRGVGPAFRPAFGVLDDERDGVAGNPAVPPVEGQLQAADLFQPQRGDPAGQRLDDADPDRLPGRDLDASQRIGAIILFL